MHKMEMKMIFYTKNDASSERNDEDDFSGSDHDFLGYYDE